MAELAVSAFALEVFDAPLHIHLSVARHRADEAGDLRCGRLDGTRGVQPPQRDHLTLAGMPTCATAARLEPKRAMILP